MAIRRQVLILLISTVAALLSACAGLNTMGLSKQEPQAPPPTVEALPQIPAPVSPSTATTPAPLQVAKTEAEPAQETATASANNVAKEADKTEHPPAAAPESSPQPPPGSKEGAPAQGGAATEAALAQLGRSQYVSLNFDNADLELVLRSIADITGINFIIGPGVKANVTMRTTTKVPASEVFSIMESVLEVNNLAAIKEGLYYKIVPIAVAQQEPQDVQVGKERAEERERYVTQIVPLDHLSADEMTKILQPFMAKGAKMLVHKETNSLIIAGFSSTIKRLLDTVRALDIPSKRDNIQRVFVYFVENVKATELANILNTLYGRRDLVRGVAAAVRPGQPPARPGVGAPPPPPPSPVTPGQPPPPPQPGIVSPPGAEAAPGEVVGDVTIVSDEATNALIIKTSPRNYEIIEATIKRLDIVPKQVIIEALLAEVTLTDELQFSLEAFVKTGSFVFQQVAPGGPALSGLKSIIGASPGTFVDGAQGFTFTFVQSDKYRTFLNNVAAYTKVNILAAPHLLTANNKEAKLQIGQEVPIITNEQASLTTVSTAQSAGTSGVFRTIQQKDIGILLGIKPHINEKRLVTLDIETEQTDILSESFGSTGSPAFSKRSSKTAIVIEDGQSLVLGGIIQNRIEKTHTGVPFLSRLPLLGYLFRNTKESFTKTELLILITPHVIASPEEGRALTQQFERRIETVGPLLKSLPAPSPSGLAPQPE